MTTKASTNHAAEINRQRKEGVYIASLDTGGISYSGREFVAVAKTEEQAKAALFLAVEQDGLPVDYDGKPLVTLRAVDEYFGIRVYGPLPVGAGLRIER